MGNTLSIPSVCDVVLALGSIYGKDGPFDSLAKLSYLHTKAKDEDSKLWLVGHVAHMVENNVSRMVQKPRGHKSQMVSLH